MVIIRTQYDPIDQLLGFLVMGFSEGRMWVGCWTNIQEIFDHEEVERVSRCGQAALTMQTKSLRSHHFQRWFNIFWEAYQNFRSIVFLKILLKLRIYQSFIPN